MANDLKARWDASTPIFKNKVSNMLSSGDEKKSVGLNPFLDNDGNLVNPYIDYQRILDDSSRSDKVKNFIQQATGLTPTVTATANTANTTAYIKPTTAATGNTSSGTASSGNAIVNAAKKYLGTPYVWGGESASEGGMDCSGFVYNALKDSGHNVGRMTAQDYRGYGQSVSKSNMQPGDLVFYGKNGNASHIGIYLGNGQMIHSSGGSNNTASNPGKGVTITNVDYRNDFLEARRY